MNSIRNIIGLVVFFMVTHTSLFAQATEEIVKDSVSTVTVKQFSKNINKKYSGREFDYTTNDTDGVNLLQVLLRKMFGWIGELFGFDYNADFLIYLEYFIYVIFGIIIIYLIVKAFIDSPINAIFKKEDRKINTINFTEESIEKVDFDRFINDAVKEQNYRLAVRYLYLKSLQLLSVSNVIEWHYDKTNAEYQAEIKNPETKKMFKSVSYIYDYVWYGEFAINESDFEKTRSSFNQLNQSIR